jgi:hypothetical protein
MIYQDYLDKNRLKSLLAHGRVVVVDLLAAFVQSDYMGWRQGRFRLRGRARARLRASRLRI